MCLSVPCPEEFSFVELGWEVLQFCFYSYYCLCVSVITSFYRAVSLLTVYLHVGLWLILQKRGVSCLRFVSWNVKGINGPSKRGRVFSHLKHLKAENAFLQETQLITKDHYRLKASWVGQSFHSNFSSKARGTAILIHKKIQFSPTNVVVDHQGRFVVVSDSLHNVPAVLVSLYAPNWDDEAFIRKVISLLPDLSAHHLILGGDLNCTIDPLLGKSCSRQDPPSKMAKTIS